MRYLLIGLVLLVLIVLALSATAHAAPLMQSPVPTPEDGYPRGYGTAVPAYTSTPFFITPIPPDAGYTPTPTTDNSGDVEPAGGENIGTAVPAATLTPTVAAAHRVTPRWFHARVRGR